MYSCRYCSKEFAKSNLLASHVVAAHKKPEKHYICCKYCGKKLNVKHRLTRKHIEVCRKKHEPYICKVCGKLVTTLYGTGKFCSIICRNTRKHSEATKQKLRDAVKRNGLTGAVLIDSTTKHLEAIRYYVKHPKFCKICGARISYKRRYSSETCGSHECKYKNCGGFRHESRKTKSKSGYYKGIWCDSTWELAFVIFCIDHNIPFSRNVTGFQYLYNGKYHKFYPDFIINNRMYIEIKGMRDPINDAKQKSVPHPIKFLYYADLQNCFEYCRVKYKANRNKLYVLYDK